MRLPVDFSAIFCSVSALLCSTPPVTPSTILFLVKTGKSFQTGQPLRLHVACSGWWALFAPLRNFTGLLVTFIMQKCFKENFPVFYHLRSMFVSIDSVGTQLRFFTKCCPLRLPLEIFLIWEFSQEKVWDVDACLCLVLISSTAWGNSLTISQLGLL